MAKKLAHISEDHSREQTVYKHLTGTAELAKQFAAVFGAEEDGYLLGLLHATSASTAMPFSID